LKAVDERAERLSLAVPAAHGVRVDPKREAWIRMPQLCHHVGRVASERDEDRSERVTELVSCHAFGERMLTAFRQELVGAGDDRSHDAETDVVAIPVAATHGREHALIGSSRAGGESVLQQLVAQNGQEVDLTHFGVGL
jgi:hypothetical protein